MKIVLCGFMGCGKTSVGWRLAKRLGWRFVDMDKFIEEKEGMLVADIFSQKGEDAFRAAETQAIDELMSEENIIVATGGGTVLNPDNVAAFHRGGGIICFLDVPVIALQERLKTDKVRPLLRRPDKKEFIVKLHSQRYPKYMSAADVIINAAAPAVSVAKSMAEKISSGML